jgi:sporulation protein YlmC with PRC-barrel domain
MSVRLTAALDRSTIPELEETMSFRILSLSAVAALAAGFGIAVLAQEPAKSPAKKVAPDVKLSQRASEIIGMKVKNPTGKELGSINDVVLDVAKGNVRYFAVSYGGWLGLGDKLFAIPHQSFEWKRDDSGNNFLVLNLTESQLKNAPGFDQDHWPDFANDAQWRQRIETYYQNGKLEAERAGSIKR